MAHHVLWDGTKARPWGAYLVSEEEARIDAQARAKRTYGDLRRGILAALAEGPRSQRELAGLLRTDTYAINGSLWQLKQAGRVRVAGSRPIPFEARRWGRTEEQLFELIAPAAQEAAAHA
jgi:predicted ArsR family transcriptional regulator